MPIQPKTLEEADELFEQLTATAGFVAHDLEEAMKKLPAEYRELFIPLLKRGYFLQQASSTMLTWWMEHFWEELNPGVPPPSDPTHFKGVHPDA
jgi:hypothetical protein